MGTRYEGLNKIAQLQEPAGMRTSLFGRGMGAYSDFRQAHPNLARAHDATLGAMPGMQLAGKTPGLLDRWDRFSSNNPMTAMGLSMIPFAGSVPMFMDATNNVRRGNYLAAAGNAGLGALQLVGGGTLLKGLVNAGRLAKGARGAKAVAGAGQGLFGAAKGVQAAAPAARGPIGNYINGTTGWQQRLQAWSARPEGARMQPFRSADWQWQGWRGLPGTAFRGSAETVKRIPNAAANTVKYGPAAAVSAVARSPATPAIGAIMLGRDGQEPAYAGQPQRQQHPFGYRGYVGEGRNHPLNRMLGGGQDDGPVPYGSGGAFDPQLPPSRYRGLAYMNPYEDPASLPFGGMPSNYWSQF